MIAELSASKLWVVENGGCRREQVVVLNRGCKREQGHIIQYCPSSGINSVIFISNKRFILFVNWNNFIKNICHV
jgi:hypothetical protein